MEYQVEDHKKWSKEEEEEGEEEEVSQLVRQAKSSNVNVNGNGNRNGNDNGNGVMDGSEAQSTDGGEDMVDIGSNSGGEEKELDQSNGDEINLVADQEESHDSVSSSAGSPRSQQDEDSTKLVNSVFFDEKQGLWKCRHCSWTHLIGSPGTFHIQNPNGYLNMLTNVKAIGQRGPCFIFDYEGTELTNGVESHDNQTLGDKTEEFNYETHLTTEVRLRITEKSLDEIESFYAVNPVEKQNGGSHFDSKSSFEADVDTIEEIIEEGTDIGLESILGTQDSHDLFCPNCNSCITRKVILLRRTKKVRTRRGKAKHQKLKAIDSELDAVPTLVNDENDTVDVIESRSPTPVAGDHESQTQPDVFRCLACFSFFIPTGDCFKFIRSSKDGNESENLMNSHKVATEKTTWFSKFFARETREKATEQEYIPPSIASDQTVVPVGDNTLESSLKQELQPEINQQTTRDETVNEKIDLISSFQRVPDSATSGSAAPLNSGTAEPRGSGSSSNCLVEGLMLICSGGKSDDALTKTMTSDATLNDTVVVNGHSKDKFPDQHETLTLVPDAGKTLVSTEEPAKDDTLKSQQVILNYIVSSGGGSSLEEQSEIISNKEPKAGLGNDIPIQNGKVSSEQGSSISDNSYISVGIINSGTVSSIEAKINSVFPPARNPALVKEFLTDGARNAHDPITEKSTGDDVRVTVEDPYSQGPGVITSVEANILVQDRTPIRVHGQQVDEANEGYGIDILKSIVYGGLVECITSLGVVSSAAAAGAGTLNIFVIGLANLIGGLIVISHNLEELRNEHPTSTTSEEEPLLPSHITNRSKDRYQEHLGRRGRFALHATVAILSYLIFGLLSPVVYGFSFRKTETRDYKLAAVGGAALICVFFLAIAKTYVRKPPKSYFKTVLYYITLGITSSGASYIVGDLVYKFLERAGWIDTGSGSINNFASPKLTDIGWTSY